MGDEYKWITAKEVGFLMAALASIYSDKEGFKVVKSQLIDDNDTIMGYRYIDDGQHIEIQTITPDTKTDNAC